MVMPDGHVQPCCYNGRDMGNIKTTDFGDIWNGAGYQDLRRKLLDGDTEGAGCAQCPLYTRSGWTTEQATQSRLGFVDGTPEQLANARLAREAIVAGETVIDARPVALALELSQACNFDCTFCFQEDKLLGIRGERVQSIVAQALPYARELILTGGDPFAYKENITLLNNITDEQARHVSLELYTNGALLDRHWPLLQRFDNVFMVVSVHSMDDTTYRRIMGAKDPVGRALGNIDRFVELGKSKPNWRLSLTNIVMRSTIGEVSALARFAIERNAAVSFVHMHGDYDENIYEHGPALTPDEAEIADREIGAAIALLEAAGPAQATAVTNLRYIEELLAARVKADAAAARSVATGTTAAAYLAQHSRAPVAVVKDVVAFGARVGAGAQRLPGAAALQRQVRDVWQRISRAISTSP